jgi:hypothetical protein
VQDYFEQIMRIIRQAVLDKRHGIERENALVKSTPRGLTKVRLLAEGARVIPARVALVAHAGRSAGRPRA